MKTIIEKEIVAIGNQITLDPIVKKLSFEDSYSHIIVTVKDNKIQIVIE